MPKSAKMFRGPNVRSLTSVSLGIVKGILTIIFPIYVEKPRNSKMLNILSTINFEGKSYSKPILTKYVFQHTPI